MILDDISQDKLLGLLLEGFVKAMDGRRDKQQKEDQQTQQQQLQQQQQKRQQEEQKKDEDLRTLVNANNIEGVRKFLQERPYMVSNIYNICESFTLLLPKHITSMSHFDVLENKYEIPGGPKMIPSGS